MRGYLKKKGIIPSEETVYFITIGDPNEKFEEEEEPLDMAYEEDFEGSYTYYDDEDILAEEEEW